ncbi:MAG TPA: toxin [Patescibacteria group bacterium]|nr:toxin [Patescibacteria group bacterium]
MKKAIEFDKNKSKWLKEKRGISFEEIINLIKGKTNVLDDIKHPKKENQRIFVIKIKRYVYAVPYVEDDQKIFLKTAYPSRKATKKYLAK